MQKNSAIIGGGPAGLMAAEVLSARGFSVTVYERKPSAGRKFLMAGRGGLNLTHSEDLDSFIGRYGAREKILEPIIRDFPPQALREWCEGLGEKTFIGSSGRVFPENFKASPLLRAWLVRLETQGVRFMHGYEWRGWRGDELVFQTAEGERAINADAAVLALGGASWPRLGSDGSWVDILKEQGVRVASLAPANCGFAAAWSDMFRAKFAGQPLKPVIASFEGTSVQGEIMITDKGVEGGAIYALSSLLREAVRRDGSAALILDLKPDLGSREIENRLQKPRRGNSLTNHLRKVLNLSPVATGVLMEHPEREKLGSYTPAQLAHLIRNFPLILRAPFAIDRAISTAGGVAFDSVDENLMLLKKPGIFVAGEMLDWEAPTGGYLLQASFATGVRAARGVISWAAR